MDIQRQLDVTFYICTVSGGPVIRRHSFDYTVWPLRTLASKHCVLPVSSSLMHPCMLPPRWCFLCVGSLLPGKHLSPKPNQMISAAAARNDSYVVHSVCQWSFWCTLTENTPTLQQTMPSPDGCHTTGAAASHSSRSGTNQVITRQRERDVHALVRAQLNGEWINWIQARRSSCGLAWSNSCRKEGGGRRKRDSRHELQISEDESEG